MEKKIQDPTIREAATELSYHVLIGSLLFIAIALPAIMLDVAIGILKSFYDPQLENFVLNVLVYMKYTVLLLDALLFLIFMLWAGWRFICGLNWNWTVK